VRTASPPKRKKIFLPEFFYSAGQSHIFEQAGGDGGVSADGVVGFA